ncbi:hypothetical protein BS78_09G244300 [Paspalum vaginatum]|nr:hypothetical protein BS78_09G244300 [Paspalum vaginatum]
MFLCDTYGCYIHSGIHMVISMCPFSFVFIMCNKHSRRSSLTRQEMVRWLCIALQHLLRSMISCYISHGRPKGTREDLPLSLATTAALDQAPRAGVEYICFLIKSDLAFYKRCAFAIRYAWVLHMCFYFVSQKFHEVFLCVPAMRVYSDFRQTAVL